MMKQGAVKIDLIWEEVLRRLRSRAEYEYLYRNWASIMIPLRVEDGGRIIIGIDSDFSGSFILDHYGDIFEKLFTGIDGVDYTFSFEPGHVKESSKEAEPKAEEPVKNSAPVRPKLAAGANEFTFDNFITGDENRHAFAAAQATAVSPGVYSPLFFFGTNGVGKTHLLQAIAGELRRRNPRLVIKDTTCDELLNDFYELLMQRRSLSAFRSSLSDVDVLLVDDVHRLAKKTQMQEEFFNLFNTLVRRNKQIILTSDRQPCELSDIDKRLSTRFESGLISEVGMPEFESRLAMLRLWQSKMLTQNPLDGEFLEFLAENISSSVRRLKSAYYRLATYSSLNGGSLTLERVEELLHAQLVDETVARTVSVDSIQRAVASLYNISIPEMLSEKRIHNLAEARMIAMYLSRRLTGLSSTDVGEAFGRNHATVLHAERQIPVRCKRNEALRLAISQLERQLKH